MLCLRLNENVLLDKTPKAPKLAHSDVNYSKSLVPVLVDDDGSALVVRTSALNRCSGFVLCFHFFYSFTLLPFYLFGLCPLCKATCDAKAGGDSGQNRNNHLNDEFPSVLFHGIRIPPFILMVHFYYSF